MADDLTVRSSAAQASLPAQAGEKATVDPRRAELDRLKAIAKERHGQALSDRAIEAMLTRREAKIELTKQQETNKLEFESSQAKETVAGKSEKAQEQNLKKTTGAKETRGADGLTPEDRQAVRSDPKAGPKLPPANAKPTTPEKAFELLGNMVGLLTIDGQPFDIEAYAKTLKEKPPTPPKDTAAPGNKQSTTQHRVTAQQQQTKPATTARPENGPATSRQAPGALQAGKGALSSQGLANPNKLSANTRALDQASNLGHARLSMKIGGDTNLTGTKISSDGLFNAGGGLVTGSSFDGMKFNWDAFFSLFIIRSAKDFHEWRKAMKEFRRLEGQFAIGVISLQKTMLKMRQRYEEWKSHVALNATLRNIPRNVLQGATNGAAGQLTKPEDWQRYREESQKLVRALPIDVTNHPRFSKIHDQHVVTERQLEEMVEAGALSQADADQYRSDQRNLDRQLGGTAGRMALVGHDLGEFGPNMTEEEGQRHDVLRQEYDALRQSTESQIRELAESNMGRAMLNEQRTRLNQVAESLRLQEQELMQKAQTDPTKVAELNQVRRDRADVLRQIIAIDSALTRHEPRSDEYQAALEERRNKLAGQKADLEESRSRLDSEIAALPEGSQRTEKQQELANVNRRLNGLRGLEAVVSGEGGAQKEDVADTVMNIPEVSETDTWQTSASNERAMQNLDTLQSQVDQGAEVASARRHAGAYDLSRDGNLDLVDSVVSRYGSDPLIVQAVDKAIGSALAQAYAARSEIDAELRQHTAKAQGLINQLMQLLAMSRAR